MWLFQLPRSSVYPSGLARATRVVPIVPFAPPAFSMMIGWPSEPRIGSDRSRAIVSPGPPAGAGTTSVIGRNG
jgi:hypothetical protein